MIETTKNLKSDRSETEEVLAARNALVESHLPLVRRIAAQLFRSAPSYISFDDLMSYGYQGLISAAARFEPDRGIEFEWYAIPRVKGSMQDGFRKEALFDGRRRPERKAPRFTQSSVVSTDGNEFDRGELDVAMHFFQTPMVEEQTDYRRLVDKLSVAVDKLPARLREFTEAHYFREVPLHEIARELGVSKFAVHRLRNTALREISSLLSTELRTVPMSARGLQ
jgi:RNA polymerase sigma factor (sigma-70 family)